MIKIFAPIMASLTVLVIIVSAVGFNNGLVNDYVDTQNSTSKINESEWNYYALQSAIENETSNMEEGLLESSKQSLPVGSLTVQVISGIQYLLGILNSIWEAMNISLHTILLILNIIPPQYRIPSDIVALFIVAMIMTFVAIIAYIFVAREWI